MEYFYSGGGNNRPDFTYRFLVTRVTEEMFHWCERYPLTGPFERWHVIYNYETNYNGDLSDRKETPLIQFENKQAAFMFSIAFSEFIVEDKTYEFARES